MDFQPLHDNILLEMEEEETTLQDSAPSFTENGKVIAIGADVKSVQVGDIIGVFKPGLKHTTRNGKLYPTVRDIPGFIQGKYL